MEEEERGRVVKDHDLDLVKRSTEPMIYRVTALNVTWKERIMPC